MMLSFISVFTVLVENLPISTVYTIINMVADNAFIPVMLKNNFYNFTSQIEMRKSVDMMMAICTLIMLSMMIQYS